MPNTTLLLLALSFYTRLPCPKNLDYQHLPQATICLPLVGWLVGGVLAVCFMLTDTLWSQSTAIIITLVCGVLLTGAFHEDGFADVCDAFGGGYDKERILAIMKDSQIGAYGAIGLVLLFALKISALNEIPAVAIPAVLFAGQSISRLSPLFIMYRYTYARTQDSKSKAAVYRPTLKELIVASGCALLPFVFLPAESLWAIIPLVLVNNRLAHYFYQYICGYTGDCLGASQQVSEAVFYLSLSALWTFI